MRKEKKLSDLLREVAKPHGYKLSKKQAAWIDGPIPMKMMDHFARVGRAHLRECRVCRKTAAQVRNLFEFDIMKELGL